MFEVFQDTFKCGFNGKVMVKFNVKYENSAKRQIALLSFVILPKFAEMGRIIMHQRKLQCIGFNYQIKNDYVVFP